MRKTDVGAILPAGALQLLRNSAHG